MASKQLGKLRQWAGEVVSSREKTAISEELQDSEKDIERRKAGAARLMLASEAFHHALSKKSMNEALVDGEKLLPIDALGIVMIVHGEEFEKDSMYGSSLVKLGRAHCQVATIQDAFALTFKDTFMASIDSFTQEIKDYETLRKKLDSRRLSYDAANSKNEKMKNSKKEKDKKDAADELERAKQRFEETAEDVRALMNAIQEYEITQLRDLTAFLDHEMKYVQQYLDVLGEVRADWPHQSKVDRSRSTRLTPSFLKSSKEPQKLMPKQSQSRPGNSGPLDLSEDEELPPSATTISLSRSSSQAHKVPSRPPSRNTRGRGDSTATLAAKDDKDLTEKVKRTGVTGWASNAVDSVTNRRKNKDKDQLYSDTGDGEEDALTLKKSGSRLSLGRRQSTKNKSKETSSPVIASRIEHPSPPRDKKVVRAIYAFQGTSDELSFEIGDEIIVINEVLDGWWMGELNGRQGLFPTTYVEQFSGYGSGSTKWGRATSPNHGEGDISDDGEYGMSDFDDDRDLSAKPLSHNFSPFEGGLLDDTSSIATSAADEDDQKFLSVRIPPHRFGEDEVDFGPTQGSSPPENKHRRSDFLDAPLLGQHTQRTMSDSVSTKKPPPPPPPPRRTTTQGMSPMIPDRTPTMVHKSNPSSGSLSVYSLPAPSAGNGHGFDTSPFESQADLSV